MKKHEKLNLEKILSSMGASGVEVEDSSITFWFDGNEVVIGCYGGIGFNEGIGYISIDIFGEVGN